MGLLKSLGQMIDARARRANTAHDLSKLYPHVCPKCPLKGFGKFGEGYILPFGHELCVTLVEDVGESGHGISPLIFNVERHTAAQAHELALRNLADFARTPQIKKNMLKTQDGNEFLACSGHWLVASCIRLPDMYQWASDNFKCQSLLACIPQPYHLWVFPDYGSKFRREIQTLIRDADSDGDLKISWEFFALSPEGVVPFLETK